MRSYVSQSHDNDYFAEIHKGYVIRCKEGCELRLTCARLSSAMLEYPLLGDMAEAIIAFSGAPGTESFESSDTIRDWARSTARQAADLWPKFAHSRQGAASLIAVIDILDDPAAYITQK
jgi:hypothetical protein